MKNAIIEKKSFKNLQSDYPQSYQDFEIIDIKIKDEEFIKLNNHEKFSLLLNERRKKFKTHYKRIIEENRIIHQRYYNERAILIQKIWRGYYSRKVIFDFYAYKQYLKDVTDYTYKVNEEIKRHAEEQRKQMESVFLENEEKRRKQLAGKIHHIISTKMIDGVCKYQNMELDRLYQEKLYEQELRKVGILPPETLDDINGDHEYDNNKTVNSMINSNYSRKIKFGSRLKPSGKTFTSCIPIPVSKNKFNSSSTSSKLLNSKSKSKSKSKSQSQSQSISQSKSQSQSQSQSPLPSQSTLPSKSTLQSQSPLLSKSKNSILPSADNSNNPSSQSISNINDSISTVTNSKHSAPSNAAMTDSSVSIVGSVASDVDLLPNSEPFHSDYLTEEYYGSYDTMYQMEDGQDIYTLNEKEFAPLNIADRIPYSGYEFENITDIMKKREKLLPPISTISESIIKNSEELKEWKKNNINRPRLSIPLRKEIVFKEDIPKELLQKKADGPFLPTYLLKRKLKGPDPNEASLRNQTNIYETPRKTKEDKIECDKKILCGPFNLSNHLPPYKYTKVLQHNEPWIQPKEPNEVICECPKFEGKHDFRTRLTNLCYDAYKDDFE